MVDFDMEKRKSRVRGHAVRSVLIFFAMCLAGILSSCVTEETAVRKPGGGGFIAKPCVECHKEKLNEFQKKFVHAPYGKKECESCHIRHGKLAVKSFKEREELKLCYLCHAPMAAKICIMRFRKCE